MGNWQLQMRAGQRRFMQLTELYRVCAFLARRQYGKTTTFAKIALRKMMKRKDHTVIFGSAKLGLSREIVRKESSVLQASIAEAIAQAEAESVRVYDSSSEKRPDVLTPDDFADLFEAQRLEFRYYHSRNSYSRTKVVALHEDSVGDTGDLMCDELRAIQQWMPVWEAVSPIIAADPTFRCTLSTTIPRDDSHYAFEQLMPPPGTEFTPRPDGNVYESEHGIMVLRLDAYDAYEDGIPLYDDKTGDAISPAESRDASRDKDAWDRNYGCKFILGGTAACGILQLASAQERGIGECLYIEIQDDDDLQRACDWIIAHTGPGRVGIGMDVATTEKQTSNPSAFTVLEERGTELIARLIATWKTVDEQKAEAYMKALITAVERRTEGGRAKALSIDATNERYFASAMRRSFRRYLPVHLVVGSETVKKPGQEPMTTKQLLGSELVGALNDNQLTLPPEPYIKDDFRLVKRDRGAFACTPDGQGRHGDTFDGTKLAQHSLKGSTNTGEAHAVNTGSGSLDSKKQSQNNLRPDHTSDHNRGRHGLSGV